MQQMQSTNASDAPVAVIYQEYNSGNNEEEVVVGVGGGPGSQHNLDQPHTPSTNSESYGQNNNNKSNNYENHDNNDANADDDHSNDVAANAIPSPAGNGDGIAIKTHLEMNGDPSTTTHTYQMTMSNNSHADFSQNKRNNTTLPTQQPDESNSAGEQEISPTDRCLPTETTQSRVAANGQASSSLQPREEYESSEQDLSNNDSNENCYINRSPVIEHSVSVIAQVTPKNNDQRLADNRDGPLSQVTTVCDQDRDILITTATITMGQKNTKGGEMSPSPSSAHLREFRESSIPAENTGNTRLQSPGLPTITVSDCSTATTNTSTPLYPNPTQSAYSQRCDNGGREYYDDVGQAKQEFNDHSNNTMSGTNKESAGQMEGHSTASLSSPASSSTSSYHRSPSPTSMYSQMRYNYVKLEDVPEQEEEEYEEDIDDDDDTDEGNETDEGATAKHKTQQNNVKTNATFATTPTHHNNNHNLDNEFLQRKNSASLSPDRQQYARSIEINHSNNSTDSNLSTSYPDSGMGESIASSNGRSYTTPSMQSQQQQQHYMKHQQHFVRDGTDSTDCDETLTHCEELIDFVDTTTEFLDPSERLVCIESISLPDVVVESTNSCGNTSSSHSSSVSGGGASSSNNASSDAASGEERDIININGATGNAMGNVHFIPIHVEGSGSGRSSPRKQSVDDSVVGSGKATIEIIEDVTEMPQFNMSHKSNQQNDLKAESLKKELLEQKTQFTLQLEDAHKNVNQLQTKINEMQMKIETLEQELSTKTWNVERLQGELNAAQRDDEYVRQKLKVLEDEKTNLRHRFHDCEDELKAKYDELETQYNELQEKYKQTQALASNLQTQLAQAQTDAQEQRDEVERIRTSLEEQVALLKSALENSENERKICEDKWQREFEMLRTQNMEREESIMTDCEWQLRETQKQCKERIDKVEAARKEAVENVELLENELEALSKEADDLKIYQKQVTSLRGVVNEQATSIQTLMSQIESLKTELETANTSLQEQIEAVTKIKFHCDNALYDKERQMIYRIDEVRNEAAAFWEDKLYTEMTRLKNELESVYVDERRDALDKLQVEHVEELKALTNRYTANEEELRAELNEAQEALERKSREFLELREKSDQALLQTRMHLDRADRDFQKAMCQEEERREALELKLRNEFEEEKQEMEEKFRERLGQVKEEFAKELQINTQELTREHEKELQKLKVKLTAEKEQALLELAERHRQKMFDAEEKIKEIELRYKRDLKDLKAAYDAEKIALDKRDISNANEIEQLHRKCRCLTNLFEEMRMRYERRDPRPEDLREIAELRERCESQERDMYLLTDRLREMQIQMNELQQNNANMNNNNSNNNKKTKQVKKPPPKSIPTNCDVIYEENEERDSPPPNSYASDTINEDDVDANNTNRTDDSKKTTDCRHFEDQVETDRRQPAG
uniref:Ezrin/radixin/moesin family n=1 Tax=Musca domestica TaxID=7370 RepID=T1PGE8_MUSDO